MSRTGSSVQRAGTIPSRAIRACCREKRSSPLARTKLSAHRPSQLLMYGPTVMYGPKKLSSSSQSCLPIARRRSFSGQIRDRYDPSHSPTRRSRVGEPRRRYSGQTAQLMPRRRYSGQTAQLMSRRRYSGQTARLMPRRRYSGQTTQLITCPSRPQGRRVPFESRVG